MSLHNQNSQQRSTTESENSSSHHETRTMLSSTSNTISPTSITQSSSFPRSQNLSEDREFSFDPSGRSNQPGFDHFSTSENVISSVNSTNLGPIGPPGHPPGHPSAQHPHQREPPPSLASHHGLHAMHGNPPSYNRNHDGSSSGIIRNPSSSSGQVGGQNQSMMFQHSQQQQQPQYHQPQRHSSGGFLNTSPGSSYGHHHQQQQAQQHQSHHHNMQSGHNPSSSQHHLNSAQYGNFSQNAAAGHRYYQQQNQNVSQYHQGSLPHAEGGGGGGHNQLSRHSDQYNVRLSPLNGNANISWSDTQSSSTLSSNFDSRYPRGGQNNRSLQNNNNQRLFQNSPYNGSPINRGTFSSDFDNSNDNNYPSNRGGPSGIPVQPHNINSDAHKNYSVSHQSRSHPPPTHGSQGTFNSNSVASYSGHHLAQGSYYRDSYQSRPSQSSAFQPVLGRAPTIMEQREPQSRTAYNDNWSGRDIGRDRHETRGGPPREPYISNYHRPHSRNQPNYDNTGSNFNRYNDEIRDQGRGTSAMMRDFKSSQPIDNWPSRNDQNQHYHTQLRSQPNYGSPAQHAIERYGPPNGNSYYSNNNNNNNGLRDYNNNNNSRGYHQFNRDFRNDGDRIEFESIRGKMLQEKDRNRDGAFFIKGQCKWFNTEKGFGFITPDQDYHVGPPTHLGEHLGREEKDIFVYQSAIKMQGYRSLKDGEPVECWVKKSGLGWEAVECSGPKGVPCQGADRYKSSKKSGQDRCYNCGETGHHAKECEHPPMNKRCHFCKSEDHLVAACKLKQQAQALNGTNGNGGSSSNGNGSNGNGINGNGSSQSGASNGNNNGNLNGNKLNDSNFLDQKHHLRPQLSGHSVNKNSLEQQRQKIPTSADQKASLFSSISSKDSNSNVNFDNNEPFCAPDTPFSMKNQMQKNSEMNSGSRDLRPISGNKAENIFNRNPSPSDPIEPDRFQQRRNTQQWVNDSKLILDSANDSNHKKVMDSMYPQTNVGTSTRTGNNTTCSTVIDTGEVESSPSSQNLVNQNQEPSTAFSNINNDAIGKLGTGSWTLAKNQAISPSSLNNSGSVIRSPHNQNLPSSSGLETKMENLSLGHSQNQGHATTQRPFSQNLENPEAMKHYQNQKLQNNNKMPEQNRYPENDILKNGDTASAHKNPESAKLSFQNQNISNNNQVHAQNGKPSSAQTNKQSNNGTDSTSGRGSLMTNGNGSSSNNCSTNGNGSNEDGTSNNGHGTSNNGSQHGSNGNHGSMIHSANGHNGNNGNSNGHGNSNGSRSGTESVSFTDGNGSSNNGSSTNGNGGYYMNGGQSSNGFNPTTNNLGPNQTGVFTTPAWVPPGIPSHLATSPAFLNQPRQPPLIPTDQPLSLHLTNNTQSTSSNNSDSIISGTNTRHSSGPAVLGSSNNTMAGSSGTVGTIGSERDLDRRSDHSNSTMYQP